MRLESQISPSGANSYLREDENWLLFGANLIQLTVGVGGGGRARRHLHEEAVEKQNTPWLVACHSTSGDEKATNQNELN